MHTMDDEVSQPIANEVNPVRNLDQNSAAIKSGKSENPSQSPRIEPSKQEPGGYKYPLNAFVEGNGSNSEGEAEVASARLPVAIFKESSGDTTASEVQVVAMSYSELKASQQDSNEGTSNKHLLSEAITILEQAENEVQAQNLLDAVVAAYQRLLPDLTQNQLSTVTETNQGKEWLAFDKEFVRQAAEKLHISYQAFHEVNNLPAFRISPEGTNLDLVETEFGLLPENWQKVNTESARHLLVILQILAKFKPDFFDNLDISKLESDDVVFQISAAWYQVWADDGTVNVQGKQRNPLFYRTSTGNEASGYDEFQKISNGTGEPREGWPAFIGDYRKYILENLDTYALILDTFHIPYDTVESNGKLDPEEVALVPDEKLKKMIIRHAKYELQKDKAMTIAMLRALNITEEIKSKQTKPE